MEKDMITIATFYDHFEADVAKSKLDAYGIYCILRDESFLQQDIFGSGMPGKIELLVNEEDQAKALQTLDESKD
ncbi:MAG: DUF2007 domain-containing protein [Bacteroidetes bacterium]|nr:DUF2007 domain-containing protein [Bacteroidota bacterium]